MRAATLYGSLRPETTPIPRGAVPKLPVGAFFCLEARLGGAKLPGTRDWQSSLIPPLAFLGSANLAALPNELDLHVPRRELLCGPKAFSGIPYDPGATPGGVELTEEDLLEAAVGMEY
mmetsp:Transcript_54333/g.121988  ORF Transcript_54333/g.121988 Transcript_54333/m.121988 type:complete len:118 (-) Transcript_54333:532-885(-)